MTTLTQRGWGAPAAQVCNLSENELAAWEKKRDLNAELAQALHEIKREESGRKTEFTPQSDGSNLPL